MKTKNNSLKQERKVVKYEKSFAADNWQYAVHMDIECNSD
jgi:hypothetical protein